MPRRSDDNRGQQKGAQTHAPSDHGDKTRARQREILQSGGESREPREPREPRNAESPTHGTEGKQRLFEQREQRDEAERNSEKNRLSRDIDAHGHVRENFQVRGGAESGRAMPRSQTNPRNPDAPNPGAGLPPEETPDRIG